MSICNGVAGNRGHNPVGFFLHNDAGSKNANANFYRNWLPSHPLENGFAHYYVAQDGILQAEDDWNMAWHCGDTNGNSEYLGVEICQSMGDLEVFKHNEEKAFQLVASKCIQYGITPNENTIRLHQEVYATSCPHRSVEIHGGRSATKAYFIERIKAYIAQQTNRPYQPSKPVQPQKPSAGSLKDLGKVDIYSVGFTDRWWPEVKNATDWVGAGDGAPLKYLAFRVSVGLLKVRVHTKGSGWLPHIIFGQSYNLNDLNNGVVGDGTPIDAVEMEYLTPSGYKYKYVKYCVSDINNVSFYPVQRDNEKGNGQDGYAGVIGVSIDKLKAWIE